MFATVDIEYFPEVLRVGVCEMLWGLSSRNIEPPAADANLPLQLVEKALGINGHRYFQMVEQDIDYLLETYITN